MTLQQPFKKLKTANTQCAEQQSNLASSQTQPTIFPIPHISFPIFRYTCHPLPLPDRLAFASRLRSVNKACHSLLTTPSHFAYTIFGSHHPAIIECTKWIMGNPVLTNIKFTLDHFMEKYAEEEGVWGVLMPDYMELLKQFQVKRKEGFGEVPRVPREYPVVRMVDPDITDDKEKLYKVLGAHPELSVRFRPLIQDASTQTELMRLSTRINYVISTNKSAE